MNEPLAHFVKKHGIDVSNIERIVFGNKYSAVLLKNGNIGVCANLLHRQEVTIEELNNPDLSRVEIRIVLTAYFNATLNYQNVYGKNLDIIEDINYDEYERIVMVGLFSPVLEKLNKKNIDISVFDMRKRSPKLTPLDKEKASIQGADLVILSATTIFNRTFEPIVNSTKDNCQVFLLGPSSIMHRDMFEYNNIKMIFGSLFKSHDRNVLDIIEGGQGTRKFLQYGRKVSLMISA